MADDSFLTPPELGNRQPEQTNKKETPANVKKEEQSYFYYYVIGAVILTIIILIILFYTFYKSTDVQTEKYVTGKSPPPQQQTTQQQPAQQQTTGTQKDDRPEQKRVEKQDELMATMNASRNAVSNSGIDLPAAKPPQNDEQDAAMVSSLNKNLTS